MMKTNFVFFVFHLWLTEKLISFTVCVFYFIFFLSGLVKFSQKMLLALKLFDKLYYAIRTNLPYAYACVRTHVCERACMRIKSLTVPYLHINSSFVCYLF